MDFLNRLQPTDKVRLVVVIEGQRILITPNKNMNIAEINLLIQTTYEHIFQKKISVGKLRFQDCFLDDRLQVKDCFRDLDLILATPERPKTIQEIIDLDNQQIEKISKDKQNQVVIKSLAIVNDITEVKSNLTQLPFIGEKVMTKVVAQEQRKEKKPISLNFNFEDSSQSKAKNPLYKDYMNIKPNIEETKKKNIPIIKDFTSPEVQNTQKRNKTESEIDYNIYPKKKNSDRKKKKSPQSRNSPNESTKKQESIDISTPQKRKQSLDSNSSKNSQKIKKIKLCEIINSTESDDETVSAHLFTQLN